MKVRVKKLNELATLPTKGSEFAAGSDLYACLNQEVVITSGETVLPIPTGIAMELPVGTVGLVYARSGLATKRNLAPANKGRESLIAIIVGKSWWPCITMAVNHRLSQ